MKTLIMNQDFYAPDGSIVSAGDPVDMTDDAAADDLIAKGLAVLAPPAAEAAAELAEAVEQPAEVTEAAADEAADQTEVTE